MLSNFENIYDILNDFILNLEIISEELTRHMITTINWNNQDFQRIFSVEEIEKILSQLLFNESNTTINNLIYDDDDSQEPRFNHYHLNKIDEIDKKIAGYYDIEGPILFYDNYEHSIPSLKIVAP
jgi:hypothetical protein